MVILKAFNRRTVFVPAMARKPPVFCALFAYTNTVLLFFSRILNRGKYFFNVMLFMMGLFFYSLAQADDSTAGYVNGSLMFTKSQDISLQDESLIIRSSKINISYIFYNHTDHAMTTMVAFPFPAKSYDGSIPTGQRPCFDQYVEKNPNKDCPFLDFAVSINGVQVKDYQIHYKAFDKKGRDITKLLADNHIPLSGYFVSGVKDYDGTYSGGEIEKNAVLK
jgi:hypothetical protein